jgi:hypothetical protein
MTLPTWPASILLAVVVAKVAEVALVVAVVL